MICSANQLTGFYMRATLALNGLNQLYSNIQKKKKKNQNIQIQKNSEETSKKSVFRKFQKKNCCCSLLYLPFSDIFQVQYLLLLFLNFKLINMLQCRRLFGFCQLNFLYFHELQLQILV